MMLPLHFKLQPKGKKMNKISLSDLVKDVAETTGLTQLKVANVINELIANIETYTYLGHRVTIKGFGAFQVKTRAARTGKNPRTGEAIQIPETQRLTFSPSRKD